MIQRIQSLYLLLSAALGIVCLCRPLGRFLTEEGEVCGNLYNLWIALPQGGHLFSPWALFAILVIATALTLLNILLFTRRALQMRIASLCIILLVGYYAYLATFVYLNAGDGTFRPSLSAAFPLVCIVLDYLAFRSILKDEMLVRSLDRLR